MGAASTRGTVAGASAAGSYRWSGASSSSNSSELRLGQGLGTQQGG